MRLKKFTYCSEFKCMAEKCPESCCQQWSIFFSKSDYLKLRNAQCSEELKKTIEKALVKINADSEGFDYAVVRLDEKGVCPLLDGDGLCMLQKELGGDGLGYACRTFPRLKTKIGEDTYIYSLDMSCPKTAQLLIEHKEGLALSERNYDGGDGLLNAGVYSAPAVSAGWEGMPYYWVIKNTQIEILQNRRFTFSERMLVLGYFSRKANEYINHGEGGKIPVLAGRLKDIDISREIADSLKPDQSRKSYGVKSVSLFAKMLLRAQNRDEGHLRELFRTVADSLEITFKPEESKPLNIKSKKNIEASFNSAKYLEALEVYEKIEKERSYIIENILVNLIFPQALSEGIWKNYFIAAVFYNLLKTCVPAFLPKAFNDEELALAISRTAKMAVNNGLIKKDALLDFLDNRAYTLPHAAFLIYFSQS